MNIDFSKDFFICNFGSYVDTHKYQKGRDSHNKLHDTAGQTKSLIQGDRLGLLVFQDNSVSHNCPPQNFSILTWSRTSYHWTNFIMFISVMTAVEFHSEAGEIE